jgi:hypothetical protein
MSSKRMIVVLIGHMKPSGTPLLAIRCTSITIISSWLAAMQEGVMRARESWTVLKKRTEVFNDPFP